MSGEISCRPYLPVCLSHCIIFLKQTGNVPAYSLDLLLVVYKRIMLRLRGFCLCVYVKTLVISTFVSGVPLVNSMEEHTYSPNTMFSFQE